MRRFIRILFILGIPFLFAGASTTDIKLNEGIQVGNLVPKIALQNVDLESDGYVLLQFWASYNPESRVKNVKMHNIISQSKMEYLRLVSISFDENSAIFQGIIKADHLNELTQLHDPEGINSELFKSFHLEKGFGNWLINQKGVIVAKNISPSDILEFFNQLNQQ